MELISIIILLVCFIPITLFSLCHRKVPKYYPLKTKQYTTELQDFKPNFSVCDVTDADTKKKSKLARIPLPK